MHRTKVYEIRVTLIGARPAVWRRLRVHAEATLEYLHRILQAAMGWQDIHPHQFLAAGRCYGIPGRTFVPGARDERGVRLDALALDVGDRLIYEYDFGNNWEHELLIERMLDPRRAGPTPACLAGEGACPPEDCGGVFGYTLLARLARTPQAPGAREVLAVLDAPFDPDAFDPRDADRRLRALADAERR